MDKFDYIKIGTIHSSKISLRARRDEPKNGRRYMQYINNQAFMSRIYKEHLPISKTKMDHPTEKWANDLNRCFRRRNQSGQNQKVFNCISNQGNANQNYMKITIPSIDQNVEQFLYATGRRLSWYKIFRKEFGRIC